MSSTVPTPHSACRLCAQHFPCLVWLISPTLRGHGRDTGARAEQCHGLCSHSEGSWPSEEEAVRVTTA